MTSRQYELRASDRYDYVIVGGGSAGSALANRLSADPGNQVLVLEAGRPDYKWDVFIHMPAALTFPIGSRFYDWKYESEPEPFMNGRKVYHARGKVLGGSSSINGMIFQRGNPLDYERWAADPGMETWDYAHCLPYFKKMENCLRRRRRLPRRQRSAGARAWPGDQPAVRARSSRRCSRPATRSPSDVNGFQQEGFAKFDRNVRRGRRLSAAPAYLHPVMNRPNLTVTTRALVHRVLFDGTRATGVEYSTAARRAHASHAGEVILCGGAFNSPQLLQLSGVGNADELGALGIPVVHDLPGRRPSTCRTTSRSTCSTRARSRCRCSRSCRCGGGRSSARSGCSSARARAPRNHFEGGGFARSNDDVAYPNLMFHFLPIAVRYDGSSPAGGHGYQVHIGPMYSNSRGSVKITSTDPTVQAGAAVQLPVDARGPARMGRGDPHRPQHPGPAGDGAVQRRRGLTRARRRDRRADPRLGAHRRRDRAAPVVHLPHGRGRRRQRGRPADDGRARRRGRCGWSTRRRCATSPTATSTRR